MKILEQVLQVLFWCLFWGVWLGWMALSGTSMTEDASKPIIIFMKLLGLSTVMSTAITIYISRFLESGKRQGISFLLWILFGTFVAFPTIMVPAFFCEPSFGACGYRQMALIFMSPLILCYVFIGIVAGQTIHRYIFSKSK